MKSVDSESNLDFEPETQVYRQMSKLQGQKGVAHIITEIINEEEVNEMEDKHKYMKEMVGRKFSTLNSPTESIQSSHSSKPFQSPMKHPKQEIFFGDNDFLIQDFREYDYIEIKKYEKNMSEASEQESRLSAKKIVSLLKKRDQYNADMHSDWSGLEEITTYKFETKEPTVDWREYITPLGLLEKAEIHLTNGVYAVQINEQWVTKLHSIMEFIKDLLLTVEIANDKMITSFCYARTKFLESKFKMHTLFNSEREAADQKRIKNRDFYNILKIDTHIHHSQFMNGRQLLEFMKNKFRSSPEEIVYYDEQFNLALTLKDISEKFRFKPEYLNLDLLDVQADKSLYKRFDRFTSKYSPLGQPVLRNIFLKTENYIRGKYIAELTKEQIDKSDPHVYAEFRITIYGKSMNEWKTKAKWLIQNKLQHPNIRWMIQIPRLYSVYRSEKIIFSFQDMIDNIFRPLFEVTINPAIDLDLYQALFTINGFDCVDDENKHENFFLHHLKIHPNEWTKSTNPHYAYWIYYIYANLQSLNQLRQIRGLNTYDFRPHCGEAGNIDHLACAYLLAKGINHGLVLEDSPVLKYLYYLKQIGISMSPIANNKLICKYADSPFNNYFRLGLNVCLSTDDPLMLHMTEQPLLEEYAIASQVFDLSNVDLAEIARNSVRCSSFETSIKEYFIGENPEKMHKTKNNPERNNIPQSRFLFRQETLNEEYQLLKNLSQAQ